MEDIIIEALRAIINQIDNGETSDILRTNITRLLDEVENYERQLRNGQLRNEDYAAMLSRYIQSFVVPTDINC